MSDMLQFSMAACCTLFILASNGSLAADVGSQIAAIRELYASVESSKPLRSQKSDFKLKDEPMEGTITVSEYQGDLTKITLSYVSSDHGGAEQTFYYGKGGLFFVFEVAHSWKFGRPAANGDSTTIDRRVEHRYYFDQGQCIRRLRRSAEAADPKKLPRLIGDEKNLEIDPGEDAAIMFKRALALRGVTTSAEAARYFELE